MISAEEQERWENLLQEEGTNWDLLNSNSNSNSNNNSNSNSNDQQQNDFNNQFGLLPLNEQSPRTPHTDSPSSSTPHTPKQTTMEQLIRSNIQLTENLNHSLSELTCMEERALDEKHKADDYQKQLEAVRESVGLFLSVLNENKQRHQSEQEFWDKIANTDLLKKAEPPPYFEATLDRVGNANFPPSISVVRGNKMSNVEAENFRASYQRVLNENKKQEAEIATLKKKLETRGPIIQRLVNAARKAAYDNKHQLVCSVRRIRYLTEENEKLEKKNKHLNSYVSKLETSTMRRSSTTAGRYEQQKRHLARTGTGSSKTYKAMQQQREEREKLQPANKAFLKFKARPLRNDNNDSTKTNTNTSEKKEGEENTIANLYANASRMALANSERKLKDGE